MFEPKCDGRATHGWAFFYMLFNASMHDGITKCL